MKPRNLPAIRDSVEGGIGPKLPGTEAETALFWHYNQPGRGLQRIELKMTLTLHLPTGLEESIKRLAAASGMDLETFVIEAVRSKVGESETGPPEAKIATVQPLCDANTPSWI